MAKKITSDIFSLFTSSFIGQIIHVIALPYLTICFSKEDIGAFFFFQSIIGIGLILITLQSEQAIVIESNKNSYSNYKKSIIILTVLTFATFLLTYFLSTFLDYFSLKTSISSWIILVSPVIFICGFNNTTEYLLTHEKKFKSISFFRISRPILIYLFAFLYHFLDLNIGNSLILGFLSGNLVISFIILAMIITNKLCHFNKYDFTAESFKIYYLKHKNILVFNTLSTGLNSASTLAPYLFISFIFGEKYSAYYGMSMRIIGMPFGLLGQSFGQVFLQKFSSLTSYKHSFYPVLKKLIVRLYSLGIIPFLILLFFTPQLYLIFLGKGWEVAALLSKILLPCFFLEMITSPISNFAAIMGVQHKTIVYDLSLFFLKVISLFICWKLKLEFIIIIGVLSVIGVVFSIVFQYFFLNLSKNFKP